MPRCRVYLFTYNRPILLQRAIQSLIDQKFSDWICEVHNDNPTDTFPQQHLMQLNDSRFIIKDHPINLGGTKSFNIAFSGCTEDYASILEDDNWWEPLFLEEMINLMDQKPDLAVAWSNMRVWSETVGNKWGYTGKTIWDNMNSDTYFYWPHTKQAMGALYSNGAMIYRGNQAPGFIIPDNCVFGIMEAVRERSFTFPIYLVSKPLANFSQTILTHRSNKSWIWTFSQTMLLSSFISTSADQEKTFKELLLFYRDQKPSPVTSFFLSVVFFIKKPHLVKLFTIKDWFIISKWIIKNVFNRSNIKNHLKGQKNVYNFLLNNTANLHKNNAS
jgi:glycosyltransferase involved in cell wall biosynthesis